MKRNVWKAIVCFMMMVAMLVASIPASAASTAYIMKVNADRVRLRGSAGDIIRTMRKGTKVLYWGSKDGSMYKVLTSDGKTGYVYKNYLSTYGAMKVSSVYVTTSSAPTYKRSGNNLKRSGSLAAGKYVMVMKTSGNWAYAKTMTGRSIYLQKSYLKKVF